MKFAIVLLGLVALASANPQERGIIETVENLVQNVIGKATSEVDNIISAITGLTSNTESKVGNLIDAAKNQVASTVDNVESAIANLIVKGGTAAICAQAQLATLDTFKTQFSKNVESCTGSLSSDISNFETGVLTQVTALKASISQLVAIVEECTTNILDAVLCAVTKVGTVEKLVSATIDSAKSAITSATSKAANTVATIQTCATQTVGAATIEINKIFTGVKSCM